MLNPVIVTILIYIPVVLIAIGHLLGGNAYNRYRKAKNHAM